MGIHEQASMLERRFGVQKSTQFGDVTTEGICRVSLPSSSRYHNLKKVSVPLEMSGCMLRDRKVSLLSSGFRLA